MKKTVSMIAIAAGLSLMGVAIVQSGENATTDHTESRDHSAFENISISDTAVGLDVKMGDRFSVTVTGPEDWVGKLITEVNGDTLVISHKKKKKKGINFNSDHRVTVVMPKFKSLKVNGAVDAHFYEIESEHLEFEVKGAGNIEVDGRCGTLDVTLDGAGNFDGGDLKCENVQVEINGAGNAEVYGSESAILDINGIGNIDLYGNPQNVEKDKSMFSNITVHKK